MRLNFRQGVVKHQTDELGESAHLYLDSTRNFVSLIVVDSPTLVTFCHRDTNYLVEETVTIIDAWGPLPDAKCWCYWDIDLVTGLLTRGFTLTKPQNSITKPENPAPDQHWFDLENNVMMVFSNNQWKEKIRVFAGELVNGRFLPYGVGSQVGMDQEMNDAGYLLLDPFQQPFRFKPPGEPANWYARFVTSETWLTVVNRGSMLSKLDSGNFPVLASEPIPKFSLVQMKPERRVELARHTDHTTRVNGVILEDMYKSDVSDLFCHGMIANNDWNWPDEAINKPLFCGAHGEITTSAPQSGVYQQIGYVFDRNAIFLDLMPVIILDEISNFDYDENIVTPPQADFTVDVVDGYAPLTVKFTSTSTNTEQWEWDFENNDHWDSTGHEITHVFENVGVYTVKHRASNQYGSDVKIVNSLIRVNPVPEQESTPNLKAKLAAIGIVKSGVTFKVRFHISNVGLGTSYRTVPSLSIRTDSGTDVFVAKTTGRVSKTGAGTSTSPKLTSIIFPEKDLNSNEQELFEVELKVDSYARNVIISGNVNGYGADSTPIDNSTTLQLPIRY